MFTCSIVITTNVTGGSGRLGKCVNVSNTTTGN